MKKNGYNLFSASGPSCKGRVKVVLTPLGDKIKFRVVGRVYCTRMQQELPNSHTYPKSDLVWLHVFRTWRQVERFLKRNKPVARVISLYDLGYDGYDQLVPAEKSNRPIGTGYF
jgi:hypothetical protein